MKRIILYICFILSAFTAASQPGNDQNPKRGEKIRALYIAYISQQQKFTPQEAQQFWPVHDQFENEMQEVNKSNLSDLDKQQKMLDLKKKYQPMFGKIIGNERSNNFYRQHDQFRDKLMEARQMRQNGGGGPGMKGRFKPGGGGLRRGNLPE